MSPTRKTHWRNVVATVLVLLPVVTVVIYSSLQVNRYECEVCKVFEGREVCRTVAADTEAEGLRSATDNACALLTSGVTNTLRCEQSRPTKAECRASASGPQ